MSFSTTIMYEGDSVLRFAPESRASVRSTVVKARVAPPVQHRFRHGAIKTLFGVIWSALRSAVLWLDEKSQDAHYRQVERYLAQSTDHADLERRLRDLECRNQMFWTDCGSR